MNQCISLSTEQIFLGIDHGTTAIRFSIFYICSNKFQKKNFELLRTKIINFSTKKLKNILENEIGTKLEKLTIVVMTYSMGDNITKIENIKYVYRKGVISQTNKENGAGFYTGSGTKIYNIVKIFCKNAYIIPGIHRKSKTDERLKVYSHQASPDKVSAAYYISKKENPNFILSDIGANTVTIAICKNKILGGLDACIFAPGFIHGAIDLEHIRKIDNENKTANYCFSNSGVFSKLKNGTYEKKNINIINKTISLFASMEILSLSLLFNEKKMKYKIFISGTGSERQEIIKQISMHLKTNVFSIGKWASSEGCAYIAKDIHNGKKSFIGIKLNRKLDHR